MHFLLTAMQYCALVLFIRLIFRTGMFILYRLGICLSLTFSISDNVFDNDLLKIIKDIIHHLPLNPSELLKLVLIFVYGSYTLFGYESFLSRLF